MTVISGTRPRTRHIVLFTDAVLLLRKLKKSQGKSSKRTHRYQYDTLIPLKSSLIRQATSSSTLHYDGSSGVVVVVVERWLTH